MRSPIVIPRGILSVKYIMFILLGLSIYIASSPSVDEQTPDWFTPVWGLSIAAPAVVAAFASFSERWETAEFWALVLLVPCIISYPIAAVSSVVNGDTDRLAFSVAALLIALLPTGRWLMLLPNVGKRHE